MVDDFVRGILYQDFPVFYTWHLNGKFWQRRVHEGRKQVGRIVSAHPAKGERYYLRVLLNHVVGATSYEHLKMVDGVVQPTFREAAERRGLIEEDNTLDEPRPYGSFYVPNAFFTTKAICNHFGVL